MLHVAQRTGLQAILDSPVEFVKASAPFGHSIRAGPVSTDAVPGLNKDATGTKRPRSSLESGIEIAEPRRILFPDNSLARDWQKVMSSPPGLHNTGNTCFLNSVMQVLMHVPGLVIFLLSGQHSQDCRLNNCVFCKLEEHAKKAYPSGGTKRGNAFRPAYAQSLKQIGKQFRPGRQEDAHEFLLLLLDQLQQSSLQGQAKTLDQRSKETTVIHRLFGGHMRQQITCAKCKEPSNTYEATLVLSLDCLGTIEQGLSRLTANETLTGKNRYKCEKCKSLQEARKQTTIYDAPENLILHLKRFHFAGRSAKLTKPVSFEQRLDLTQYMAPGRTPGSYRLAGVLVHQGSSANTGHYYAFGKGSHGTWNEFNDTSVSQSGIDRIMKQQAYLLLYTRVGSSSAIPRVIGNNVQQLKNYKGSDHNTADAPKELSTKSDKPQSQTDRLTFEELTQGGKSNKKRRHSGIEQSKNKKHRIFSQMKGKR